MENITGLDYRPKKIMKANFKYTSWLVIKDTVSIKQLMINWNKKTFWSLSEQNLSQGMNLLRKWKSTRTISISDHQSDSTSTSEK
jgi:hypothetical protein